MRTMTTLALRCPVCGKFDFHTVSLFAFSGGARVAVRCDCGSVKAEMMRRRPNHYWITLPCIICETEHQIFIASQELWKDEIHKIYCPETLIEMGILGEDATIRRLEESNRQEIEALVDELGYDDYFTSPEIMYEVLNRIHAIAEKGGIVCQCQSLNIEVVIYPERLELVCRKCGRTSTIPADTVEDLERLRRTEQVVLTRHESPKVVTPQFRAPKGER